MLKALATAALLVPTLAQAGVISGGGGGAFVCRDASGAIQSAELLDLWEAHAMGGHTVLHDSAAPVEAQFEKAAARLATIDSALADAVRERWRQIQGSRVFADSSVVIHPPADANNVMEKAGCPLEGMMFFDDSREKLILKKETFFAQKDNTELAAAYFHEALYKAMRDEGLAGARDSVQTRILVGCLFAEGDLGGCLNLKAVSAPKGAWTCEIPADADHGEPGLTFLLYKEHRNDAAWKFVAKRVGDAKFGFETAGVLAPKIQTLPGFNGPTEPGSGDFQLDESLRITGLKDLGFPFPAGSEPFGDAIITIWKLNPLTVSHGDNETKYRCH